MNAYLCTAEGRTVGMSYDPPDPGEYFVPTDVIIARSPGRAKVIFMHDQNLDFDEFIYIKVRVLEKDLPLSPPSEGSADKWLTEDEQDEGNWDIDGENTTLEWIGPGSPDDFIYSRLWGKASAILGKDD